MKKLIIMFALLLGVVSMKAQSNDLYQGITKKLPYRQMVTPYGVQVTFAKTVHIIFPSAVKYVDLGSNYIIAGKAEPEMLNIEMKDFLENEDTTDFSHTRMNIYFRELGNESPLLVKLIMQSIYKNNDREIKHLGCKRFGVQFLVKGIYSHNGLFYFHTQTKNSSNVPFDTDFIRFKIVDKKVAKRTAIQETVIDPVRSYNEILVIGGKSTVRTVYTVPQFTIPDDKILVIELVEKNGGRHQTIRVENSDIVAAKVINELKIK
ncbi:conjugative transposon protein TraN [Bacteroides intestinalis]|uniref:conjugative transposon protein TraN n=1 Tax=Bacteroides intestinalis TaxID=329854 RepID=UPI0022E7D36E|nr:conjugative transposon protein TraN [Bacteroides intestinalis]